LSPVPVLNTTTVSPLLTKPRSRNFASAAQSAPPSGQTSIPLFASARVPASASASVTAIAVPFVSRNASRQMKPPSGEGTRNP
jgi:hypothetical protein